MEFDIFTRETKYDKGFNHHTNLQLSENTAQNGKCLQVVELIIHN